MLNHWMFALPLTGAEPCSQVDPEIFYEEVGAFALQLEPTLKEICSGCPILSECREYAIKHEKYGFWGGMTVQERHRERRRRNIFVESPSVINERVYRDRLQEVKARESDDLRRLPTRSDLQRSVARSDQEGTSAA